MYNSRLISLVVTLLVAISYAEAQQTSDKIEVSGLVEKPMTLTLADLQKLPIHAGGPLKIVGSGGSVRKEFTSFKGVLLTDVLNAAHIQMTSPKDKGKYIIVARATDGYTAVFAHNELYNNPTGQQVFVLFDENGSPIGADGAFVLVAANDLVTGARHVKWLNRITVQKVE